MKLTQYYPTLDRLSSFQTDLSRLFDAAVQGWTPALDVHEDKDAYTVRVELPGMKREEIEVSLQDDSLVISGERKTKGRKDETEVHRQERFYGKFSRALAFPTSVAGDKVTASYKDGVLTVTVPKAEEAKPKHITISE